jgi:heterodisulfide reductase subunit B
VELADVSGFTCCPEPTGFSLHEKLTWLTVAARNISLAEEQGLDILTLCNGCYYTLKHTVDELEDQTLRGKVNEALAETGHQYAGKAKVRHFIQVLAEEVGVKNISDVVKRPLEGLRVAAHTGCHFSNRYGLDAKLLDQMVQALGATSVDYDLKNLCCGWMIGGYGQQEEGYAWLKNRLESMRRAETDCVTVICPQCYQQYDTGQMMAARKLGIPFKVPVLFYLQLLGLAMGYSLEEMQYGSHRVKDSGFEEKVRTIRGV